MKEIVEIQRDDIKPDSDEVFKLQEIPSSKEPSENIITLFKKAMELFLEYSHPIGIISQISIPEFEKVYKGEMLNEKQTPLDEIFRKADNLALFVLTIGENAEKKIEKLFKSNEFALGSMLDAVTSAGADKAADTIENHFFNLLSRKGKTTSSTRILRYSPGYCGWHVSGQKKLFAYLHPEEIDITLLNSFLMKPLKSISGVLVAGDVEIHIFDDSYPFCSQCKTHSCRTRIRQFSENQGLTTSKDKG